MNTLKVISVSAILAILLWPSLVFAEQNNIVITHKLVSVTPQGDDYADVVFELTVTNNTLQRYGSVNLVPRSEDILGSPNDYVFHIGRLPISGVHKSYWEYKTLVDLDSFTHAPILVFDLQATKRWTRTKVNFPVFSEMEGGIL